ncbi:putative DNA modification/repair radical SAM protein [Cardiobacteriaceae bacterium TAE3-ERU3]|nr:putative DNA modification/repair radical SAM protein [Cardiobacteriaceae bacterium TAE3-ERU3]
MINHDRLQNKLTILADAAKYDVSCSSSGGKRDNKGGLGNASKSGICHTYTEDGRCVSLLKILLSNHCIYDCAYCVSRSSNDVERAAFTVEEVVALTINFYRRNYIEGLFLSSGIFKNPDHTMSRMILIAKKLREEENFHGYIHLKTIPKAAPELIREAGLYADRLSINMEIPTPSGLAKLAPEKDHQDMIAPMKTVRDEIVALKDMRKTIKSTPKFAPAGQSTQLIVGATAETDRQIIDVANNCYKKLQLKRVYYSGYVPVLEDSRLPAIGTAVPQVREHRLYQADWLMRFYGFQADEILDRQSPFLDLDIDPKLAWALRHRHQFPIHIQYAPLEMILRVPGIGSKSAHKIVAARRNERLTLEHIRKMGAAVNRAKYFIITNEHNPHLHQLDDLDLKQRLATGSHSKYKQALSGQMPLFT